MPFPKNTSKHHRVQSFQQGLKRTKKEEKKANAAPRVQPWVPMTHSCPVCCQSTTSGSFKRSCLEIHQIVCPRFHRSFVRPNKGDQCTSCITESKVFAGRDADIAKARVAAIQEACELGLNQGLPGKKQRKLKTPKANRLQLLIAQQANHRIRTDQEMMERQMGYEKWRRKKIGDQ